jgi:hypothetical protein
MQLRIYELGYVKTDPLIDPLRQELRFQAIERELKSGLVGRVMHGRVVGAVDHLV